MSSSIFGSKDGLAREPVEQDAQQQGILSDGE